MASYDFKNTPCDAQFLIPTLNILGDNLIGIELGVGQGQSTLGQALSPIGAAGTAISKGIGALDDPSAGVKKFFDLFYVIQFFPVKQF